MYMLLFRPANTGKIQLMTDSNLSILAMQHHCHQQKQ